MEASADPVKISPEPTVPDTALVKNVKPRTDAQRRALEAARSKALKMRQERAELKKQEKEVSRLETQRAHEARTKTVKAKYEALTKPIPEEEEEEEVVKKKPSRRRVIVHEASSGSENDDTVEVLLPKPARPSADEIRYRRTQEKLFEYQG